MEIDGTVDGDEVGLVDGEVVIDGAFDMDGDMDGGDVTDGADDGIAVGVS